MIGRPRIRQLGLGELLDETFRLYRAHFLDFIAIAALILVPYTILTILVQLPMQQQIAQLQSGAASGVDPFAAQSPLDVFSGILFSMLGSFTVAMLYTVIFQPLMEGALALAVAQHYLDRPTGIGDSFGMALRRSPALIGARLIPALLGLVAFGLPLFLIGLLFVVFGIRLDGDPDAIGGVMIVLLIMGFVGVMLLLALVGAFVRVRIFFTSQAVMVEDQGAWSSLVRSWRLTAGYFWRTVGYLLLIGLLTALLSAIPGAIVGGLIAFGLRDQLELQMVINASFGAVAQILIAPFAMVAYTLMYFDLRIRKEGFDLEQQTSAMFGDHGSLPLPSR